MNNWRLFLILMLTAAMLLMLSACSESVLPPKETEAVENTPRPTPAPKPTPTPFPGEIEVVEINQALSYGVDSATGELYPMEDFVARRSTAVFVHLSEALGHAPDERQSLELYRGTELLGSYAPNELSTEDCLCYSISGEDAAALEAGIYEFRALVDNASLSRRVLLTETRDLRVLLVPVLANFGGSSSYPAEGWQNCLWHLQACWPLADDGLAAVTAPGMDLSGENYDLSHGRGMWNVWEALRERVGLLGEFDLVVGLVNGSMGEEQSCNVFGRNGVVLINSAQTAPEAAISHFAGHVFGAGDEYEGGVLENDANPAPFGVRGIDAVTGGGSMSLSRGVENASDYGLSCSGSVVRAEQIPFDVLGRRLLDNAASFMGDVAENTEHYWISSDLWTLLFDALSTEAAPAQEKLPEGDAYKLRVSGLLGQDGSAAVRSVMRVADDSASPMAYSSESGAYKVSFADAEGEILRSFWFDLDFLCMSDPPTIRTLAPFDLFLPVPAGAALLQIYGPVAAEDGTVTELQLMYESVLSDAVVESVFALVPDSASLHGIVRVAWHTLEQEPEEVEEKEEEPEPVVPYYELYMCYDDVQLLVYQGTMSSAELDMLSLPKPEHFTLKLLTCAAGYTSVTETEPLQLPA